MNYPFQKLTLHRKTRPGFSLVELLVAMAVFMLLAVLIVGIIQATSQGVSASNSRIEAFQGARRAFETITSQLSQATLNTYYDYYDANGNPRDPQNAASFVPRSYGRKSELQFISGRNLVPSGWDPVGHSVFFQAPLGHSTNASTQQLENTLNSCGFFTAFRSDANDIPSTLPSGVVNPRSRFRLFRWIEPTEKMSVYNSSSGTAWFTQPLTAATGSAADERAAGVHPIADNVLLFAVLPRLSPVEDATGASLAGNYSYNSRTNWTGGTQPPQMHQLPPLLEVVMITVDETSMLRKAASANSSGQALGLLGVSDLNSRFTDATKLDTDIAAIENSLAAAGVNYRTFRRIVPIRSSKWSSSN